MYITKLPSFTSLETGFGVQKLVTDLYFVYDGEISLKPTGSVGQVVELMRHEFGKRDQKRYRH